MRIDQDVQLNKPSTAFIQRKIVINP